MSNYGSDDVFEDSSFDDEGDIYDDPYEVVMYDIDEASSNDVHALLNMLTDSDRAWFAKRRLNVLAASGPLSALVARIIVDSLGRRWDPLLHPRDRFGQFIETGGFFRWFMKGEWAKGQVVRIDSDGVIHARSKGNDGIPDGTPIKFNSKQANKLISTASDKASLSGDMPDFDAEIPGFPEASPAQRRVYNALQFGDMPGEDLYIYRDPDMGSTDFGNEMADLVNRELIAIDKGDKPRARRTDEDALGVLNMSDDEIGDVPDDETPDLDDSPALTKAQRDLYDRMVEMDRGEGDGIGRDELTDVDEADLDALVEAGVLDTDGDRFGLVNPEGVDEVDEVDAEIDETDEPQVDVIDEMERAAEARFPRSIDQQEAFIQRAGELAGVAEEEEGAEFGRDERRARNEAEAWWEEFNAPEPDADTPEAETDPDALQFDRPLALRQGRTLLAQFMTDEELDTPLGEEYARGVGYLIHAQDLEAAGDDKRAQSFRSMADTSMKKAQVPDVVREQDWEAGVQAFRADRDAEAEEVDVPEADVPEDVPEAEAEIPDPVSVNEVDEDFVGEPEEVSDPISVNEVDEDFLAEGLDEQQAIEDAAEDAVVEDVPADPWVEWNNRMREADLSDNFDERLRQERRFMDELGINYDDENGSNSWNRIGNEVGAEEARELFDRHGGSVGDALDELEDRAAAADIPEADAAESDMFNGTEAPEIPEFDTETPEFDTATPEVDVPEADAPSAAEGDLDAPDATSASADPVHKRIIEQRPFEVADFDFVTDEGQGLLNAEGQPVVLGGWVRARRGGGGDPLEVVGYYDQDKFPGWIIGRRPDGKFKAVHVIGKGRTGGVGAIPDDVVDDVRNNWAAQNRIKVAEGDIDVEDLDELNPLNQMFGEGTPAKVGMVVEYGPDRLNGALKPGEYGVVQSVVLVKIRDKKTGEVVKEEIHANVIMPGAEHRGKVKRIPVTVLQEREAPPTAVPDPVPEADAPDAGAAAEIRPGVWGPLDNDAELVDLLNELGGEADYVDFVNGFGNPAAAVDFVQRNVEAGRIEIIPGEAEWQFKPRLRVREDAGTPVSDLPDGAEDQFEGALLKQLDSAGTTGLPRDVMIDIDDDDIDEKFDGLRALMDRGVVESFDDENGQRRYRRVAQGPVLPDGAENEMEGNILEALDGAEGPVRRSALMDMDEDDFDARREALRSLIERGVVRQEADDDGKPVFRRSGGAGSTPQSMTDEQAEEALRGGADPMLIANNSLDRILDKAGFSRVLNGDAGISQDNFWVMGPQQGDFPVAVKGHGMEDRKVFMVKRSSGRSFMPNDILNEVMAGAVSADILERHGRDDENGPLFHPRVGIAAAPNGVGSRAGGAIIMDHAAYGYSPDHEIVMGHRVSDSDLQAGGASRDILRLAMYDFLINNTQDRHGKNQMYIRDSNGQYKVVIIDNGFAYGAAEGQGGTTDLRFQDYLRKGRPSSLVGRADRSNVDEVRATVQNFVDTYSGFDVESVMNRIRSTYPTITPEQEEYVQKWLQVTESRVRYMQDNTEAVVQLLLNV